MSLMHYYECYELDVGGKTVCIIGKKLLPNRMSSNLKYDSQRGLVSIQVFQ